MKIQAKNIGVRSERHLKALAEIDKAANRIPRTLTDFAKLFTKPRVFGFIACDEHGIIHGYIICERVFDKKFEVLALATHPKAQGVGIASYLLDTLFLSMDEKHPDAHMFVWVQEEMLDFQFFLANYSRRRKLRTITKLERGTPRDFIAFTMQQAKKPEAACV